MDLSKFKLEEFKQKEQFEVSGTGMITCDSVIKEINEILSPYGLEFVNISKLGEEIKTYKLDTSEFDKYAIGDFDKYATD